MGNGCGPKSVHFGFGARLNDSIWVVEERSPSGLPISGAQRSAPDLLCNPGYGTQAPMRTVRRGLISANSFPAGRFQLLVIHQFASPSLSTLLVL